MSQPENKDDDEPLTTSMYVKFPRDEGFAVYPVSINASETEADTWDLYGSVTRYIETCPYPKIACLANKPYRLTTFMSTKNDGALCTMPMYDAVTPYYGGEWPDTGMPMSYHQRRPSILQYVAVDDNEQAWYTVTLEPILPRFGEFVCLWNAFRYEEKKPSLNTNILMFVASLMPVKELHQWMRMFIDFAKHCNMLLCQLPREFQECYFVLHKEVKKRQGDAERWLRDDLRAKECIVSFHAKSRGAVERFVAASVENERLSFILNAVKTQPEMLEQCRAYARENEMISDTKSLILTLEMMWVTIWTSNSMLLIKKSNTCLSSITRHE